MELCSVTWQPGSEGSLGRVGPCVRMTESLYSSPETITTLLIGCTPVGGSDGKESVQGVGNPGLITGSGRSPREGKGNPGQYSCLENSMDRGAWLSPCVAKSRT